MLGILKDVRAGHISPNNYLILDSPAVCFLPKSCFPSLLQAVLGHLPAAPGINQWDASGRRLLRHDC